MGCCVSTNSKPEEKKDTAAPLKQPANAEQKANAEAGGSPTLEKREAVNTETQ